MTHRLQNIEYSCSIIDKTLAMCSTVRQCTDDKEIVLLTWDIESNLEDIRRINDELRTLGKEYIQMIEDLQAEVDDCHDEINRLRTDIEDLEIEVKDYTELINSFNY